MKQTKNDADNSMHQQAGKNAAEEKDSGNGEIKEMH